MDKHTNVVPAIHRDRRAEFLALSRKLMLRHKARRRGAGTSGIEFQQTQLLPYIRCKGLSQEGNQQFRDMDGDRLVFTRATRC